MILFRRITKYALDHLNELQIEVTQNKGTEYPYSSSLLKLKSPGTYSCVVCSIPLFNSDEKFDSGSGWPSFYSPISTDKITLSEDLSHNMARIEVKCSECGSHLGHFFPDGAKSSRYCINGCCLDFHSS